MGYELSDADQEWLRRNLALGGAEGIETPEEKHARLDADQRIREAREITQHRLQLAKAEHRRKMIRFRGLLVLVAARIVQVACLLGAGMALAVILFGK